MSETSKALQKITRGTGIVFVGNIFWLFFEFLSRTIIARHYSASEYGIFNLTLTILNMTLVMTTLGFQNSLPREIAFYREREPSKLKELISTALMIVLLNSIIWTVILILGVEDIARIFHDERLASTLRIGALGLLFSSLIRITISISRGLGRIKEQVYYQNMVYSTAFLILILVGTFLDFSFFYVFFAYVIAQVFTFSMLILNIWKTKLFELRISLNLKIGRKLMVFSLPLMLSGVLGFLMNWTDTIMLGYYKNPEIVGIYNVASLLARLLLLIRYSAGFVYVPLATSFYAQEKIEELSRTYQTLTKWIFFLTLPVFSMFLLFPDASIKFLFGEKYIPASIPLQILILGFMFHVIFGLNGPSLIVLGDTRFISISDIISTILNIILNALLIPTYGMKGAAFATTVSYFINNVLISIRLYQQINIHPFTSSYTKSLGIIFVLILITKKYTSGILNIFQGFLVIAVYLLLYLFLIVLCKIPEKEDLELISIIKEMLSNLVFRVFKRKMDNKI